MPESTTHKQIPLTCYIRTLNEAARIGAVIQEVQKLGAEIIVIDSNSTDATRQIAEDAGATVIVKDWAGQGLQKRYGEDAASHDWVLDLDADEIISDQLHQQIKALFQHGAPAPAIYSLKLVTIPPVPKGGVWTDCNVAWRNKLYPKSLIRMPAHAVWDQFKVPDSIKPIRLGGALYHYSFPDITYQMGKMNSYSSDSARESRLKPKWLLALRILFGFPFYLGKKLFLSKMYKGGIYGFACAAIIASSRWLKDVKMYEMHLAKNGRNKL
tara:strand:+ start:967 stop:1773 length:807 start_codon:yes stop_codon:yes gene_type:complete